MTSWFVLQTKPNALETARSSLDRQGYRAFMPLQRITRRSRKGLQNSLRPLFPGYLFLSGQENGMNWRAISYSRGVRRILTTASGQPAQLPTEFVTELSRMTDDRGLLTSTAEFEAGDDVRVVNGPMAGWAAKVLELSDTNRVRLLLDVMGRKVPVEVAIQDLEPDRTGKC
jgi:transcriptional antiterminator RfaH